MTGANRRTTRLRGVTAALAVLLVLTMPGPADADATPGAAESGAVVAPVLSPYAAALAGLDAPVPTGIQGAAPGLDAVATSGSLADAVAAMSRLLDLPIAADEAARRIERARLAPETQAALAPLVTQLTACAGITNTVLSVTPLESLWSGAARVAPPHLAALRGCALTLRAQVDEALRLLELSSSAEEEALVLWPVLAYSPGESTDDVYREDYALLVDRGGDDWYRNNQGGNAIDLKRSHTSPAARRSRPARGCHQVFPDFSTGRLERGPHDRREPSWDGAECSAAAALLLDLGGDDRYGRYESPTFPDDLCTPDKIVRRISTTGAGVAGVGMLIDVDGDDRYRGKTGTQGAGHLGGVGLLEDMAGDDRYVAVRGAQGAGVLDGIGVLRDRAGNDVYTYRMPRPLDPSAENNADGAGGVSDDTGLGSEVGLAQHEVNGAGGTCDRLKRSVQGVGLLVGEGALIDEGGDDRYRGTPYLNQPFLKAAGAPLVHFAHGSQGSGFLGGTGALIDLGGRDRYTWTRGRPSPRRGNNRLSGPRVDPTLDPDGPFNGKPLDVSLFYDTRS